jgi:hypothetical protein
VEADEGLLTAAAPRYFATNLLLINHSDVKGRGSHDVSLDRPENALASDVFGHNRKQRFGYENTGRHFNSRATNHYWGSLYRPASDQRPGDRAKGELGGVFIALLLGDDSDAFLGSISETDKRTRHVRGVPDRVADFSGACAISGLGQQTGA